MDDLFETFLLRLFDVLREERRELFRELFLELVDRLLDADLRLTLSFRITFLVLTTFFPLTPPRRPRVLLPARLPPVLRLLFRPVRLFFPDRFPFRFPPFRPFRFPPLRPLRFRFPLNLLPPFLDRLPFTLRDLRVLRIVLLVLVLRIDLLETVETGEAGVSGGLGGDLLADFVIS